jgi:hypothetical protein
MNEKEIPTEFTGGNRIAAPWNDARIAPRLSQRWHAYAVSSATRQDAIGETHLYHEPGETWETWAQTGRYPITGDSLPIQKEIVPSVPRFPGFMSMTIVSCVIILIPSFLYDGLHWAVAHAGLHKLL